MNWLKNLFIDRTFGVLRSPDWSAFRKTYIKKECEICRARYFLELHHCIPFWKEPELELFPSNVVTLCRKHHYELGHFFSWKSYNIDIRLWCDKIKNKP